MIVEVLDPGSLTTVQGAGGRHGWRHLGVPEGGAADPWAARLANRLVGNRDEAALLELTLAGPTLRFDDAGTIALVGALRATLDGLPMPSDAARTVRAGSVLRVADGDDARAWLSFAGGIRVSEVLGSPATDLRTGFGGLGGRALRDGDRLEIGEGAERPKRWVGAPTGSGPIRLVDGPHADAFPLRALTEAAWHVGAEADRAGVRLDGPALAGALTEVPSMGLPLGAIQVTPDGRPVVMLADRPVTGGYPVVAVVIRADIGRVARLRTGDEVTFESVSAGEAHEALRRAEDELAALEPLAGTDDGELGWIGSHR